MAEQNNALNDVTQGTSQLLQEATEKTAQTVLEHTAKYNDAYSTIDKFVEAFWQRLPYICIALVVFTIFYLLSKLFKFFVRKALADRSYVMSTGAIVLDGDRDDLLATADFSAMYLGSRAGSADPPATGTDPERSTS